MRHARNILFAIGLVFASSHAAAHSVWLEPDKDGKLVVGNGHPGEPVAPYDPARVTKAWAVDKDGKAVDASITSAGSFATVSSTTPASLYAAMFDNKYWAKGQDGKWNNGPKGTVPNPTIAGPSYKFPKTYLAPTVAYARPLGLALEIIPLSDPTTLKAGDKLQVQVLLDGKPLADADLVENIYVDHEAKPNKVKTGKEGKATVTVAKGSFAGVEVSHFDKQNASSVEGTFYNASLTFRVRQ